MEDRRNPYLVLGLDYGADSTAASKAFARASRRVRREDGARYSVEDVTWALHRIEHAESDPDAALDVYRVPADSSVYLASGLEDLLPAAKPVGRITSEKGLGKTLTEAQGIAHLLLEDLEQATLDSLSDPLPDKAKRSSPQKSPSAQRSATGSSGSSSTTSDSSGVAIGIGVIVLIILILMIAGAADNNSSTGATEDTPEPPATDIDVDRDDSQLDPPPPPAPIRWVDRGDCLISRGSQWGPGSCSRRDAKVIAAQRGMSTGYSCPDETDIWFSDEWGVYCSMVVTDDTPEGGHWGIGPIHDGSCVRINSRGQLTAKSRCTRNAMPVLTTARTSEGCHTFMMQGDRAVFFGAKDGTSSYLCIDGADWQAAGLAYP